MSTVFCITLILIGIVLFGIGLTVGASVASKHDDTKHAEWIPIDDRHGKCSLCGHIQKTGGFDHTGKALILNAVYHYCTNCGAKMSEEE